MMRVPVDVLWSSVSEGVHVASTLSAYQWDALSDRLVQLNVIYLLDELAGPNATSDDLRVTLGGLLCYVITLGSALADTGVDLAAIHRRVLDSLNAAAGGVANP